MEWKTKAGEIILILNMYPYLAKVPDAKRGEARAAAFLNTALIEGARALSKPANAKLAAMKVVLVSIKDMNEYGAGKGGWTEIGTTVVARKDKIVSFDDVRLTPDAGKVPASFPTVPFPYSEVSVVANAGTVRFLMPKAIYLVAGIEQKFFYENAVLARESDEYVFVPGGAALAFATQARRALEFAPQAANIGQHVLTLKVTDWAGKLIAEGATTVIVSPPAKPVPKRATPPRVLIIGHSLASMYWPAYLADYLAMPGLPPVEFVGSIRYWYGSYPDMKNNPPLDRMYHEGSPGYSVQTLLTLYSDQPSPNPNMPPQSPFLFKDANGHPKMDMQRYVKERLNGNVPDYIVLNVGDNDTFGMNPDEKNSAVERDFVKNMNAFLDHLHRMAPRAVIGAMLPNTYNYSERAFTFNYGPAYPRWKQMQNRQRYIELMSRIASSRAYMNLIPSNFVVDGVDGMPYNSGTHFNNVGARQFAGAAFAWLNFHLAKARH
ncbi:MAG: SGNH/GDSL hydrolase family protein [Gammaproteobacteria bacterium]